MKTVNGALHGFVSRYRAVNTSTSQIITAEDCVIGVILPFFGDAHISLELADNIPIGTELTFIDIQGTVLVEGGASRRMFQIGDGGGASINGQANYYVSKAPYEGVTIKKTQSDNWIVISTVNKPQTLYIENPTTGALQSPVLLGVSQIKSYYRNNVFVQTLVGVDPFLGIADIEVIQGDILTLFI